VLRRFVPIVVFAIAALTAFSPLASALTRDSEADPLMRMEPALSALLSALDPLGFRNLIALYPEASPIPLSADIDSFRLLGHVGPLSPAEAWLLEWLLGPEGMDDVDWPPELMAAGDAGAGNRGESESGATASDVDGAGQSGETAPQVYAYLVAEGDTLWDIAQAYGVDVTTILGANPDVNASRLQVGRVIRVLSLDGVLHTVKSGDTVSGLATKYHVEASVIAKANGLTDAAVLKVGQELILPGAKPIIVHKATAAGGSSDGQTVTITGEYRWPVSGFISSRWGWRWGRFHHGLDIAAPYGRSIVASRGGKVVFAGWKGGYGNTVVLSHNSGTTTLYGHASRLLVEYGQWVEAGQVIARVGSTGVSTGNHLHFEIRVDGSSVNPLSVLP